MNLDCISSLAREGDVSEERIWTFERNAKIKKDCGGWADEEENDDDDDRQTDRDSMYRSEPSDVQ